MTPGFTDDEIDRTVLRERAYNKRWAETPADVVPLTAADPDFPIAAEIREAIIDYTSRGYFSYGPPAGLSEFREAVSVVLRERRGVDVDPDLVLPIDSAARGMSIIARMVLEPGDEAIVFDPVDFLFGQSVVRAGGRVRLCPVDSSTGRFALDRLDELVTDRTRMICLCNPHNPLGRVMTAAELDAILRVANRHGLWIMNDEIWSDIVYGERPFTSILSLGADRNERTVGVYGFSKSFGLAGLRAGYLVCPDRAVYERLVEVSDVLTTAGGVSTLSQVAATAAYRSAWYWVDAFVAHLRSIRDYAVARLNAMEGVTCLNPEGTYVLFPDVHFYGLSADEMVTFLLEKFRVAVVPGNERYFGPGGAGHIRLCFSTSKEIVREGLDRLERGLAELRTCRHRRRDDGLHAKNHGGIT